MLHFKAPGWSIQRDFVASEWGEFFRYIEVGDDQRTTRQVEVFGNGNMLRYDREHWCDNFAMMVRHKFSRKPKWAVFFPGAEVITLAEFEKIWRAAEQSGRWKQQLACSRVPEYGEF